MPQVQFNSSDLAATRKAIRDLLDATPVGTPAHDRLKTQYEAIQQEEQRNISGAISDADNDYIAFTQAMKDLIDQLNSAQSQIEKVAKVIAAVAKVVTFAGKVAAKIP